MGWVGGWGCHCTSGGWTTSYRADRKGKKKKCMDHERDRRGQGEKNMSVDKTVQVKEINAATDESKDKQRG